VDVVRPPHDYDRRTHRPLDERLRSILARQRHRLALLILATRAGNFVGAAVFVGVTYFAWFMYQDMRSTFAQLSGGAASPAPMLLNPVKIIGAELVVLAFASLWIVARGVLVGIGAGRFYEQEYLRAWQLLEHRWVGPVLAEEEYWRPIYAYRAAALVKPRFGELSRTLELHLNFGARFLEALEDLAAGPGRMRRYSARQGFMRMAQARMRWMIWAAPIYGMAIGIIGWITVLASGDPRAWLLLLGGVAAAGLLFLIVLAQQGPLLLLERARLMALCEFLLDEPQLDRESLTEPGEPGSLLRRRFVELHERVSRACGWRGAEL